MAEGENTAVVSLGKWYCHICDAQVQLSLPVSDNKTIFVRLFSLFSMHFSFSRKHMLELICRVAINFYIYFNSYLYPSAIITLIIVFASNLHLYFVVLTGLFLPSH